MVIENRSAQNTGVVSITDATMLIRNRTNVAARESEDAELTGMTRSLERRLLALNLPRGAAVKSYASISKVA